MSARTFLDGRVILRPGDCRTGSTGEAAWREGFSAVLIERDAEYQTDIARRMQLANSGPLARRAARAGAKADSLGPLFGNSEKASA